MWGNVSCQALRVSGCWWRVVGGGPWAAAWWLSSGGQDSERQEVSKTPATIESPTAAPLEIGDESIPTQTTKPAVKEKPADPAKKAAAPRTGRSIIQGVVVDEALNPVVGAKVRAVHLSVEGTSPPEVLEEVETIAQGLFTISALGRGKYTFVASHGDKGAVAEVDLRYYTSGTHSGVTLRLGPAGSVAGTVVDDEGQPVSEEEVTLLYLAPGTAMRSRYRPKTPAAGALPMPLAATTGEDGAFSFDCVPAKEVFVTALAEGLAPGLSEKVNVPAGGVVVRLAAGVALEGKALRKDTDEPVAQLPLQLEGECPSDLHQATTDAEGAFSFSPLRAGEYDIKVMDDSYALAPEAARRFKVSEGLNTSNVEVRVTAGGGIRGRVYDPTDDRGVPTANVMIQSSTWEMRKTIACDAAGHYEALGLSAGQVYLYANVGDTLRDPYSGYRWTMASIEEGKVLDGMDLPLVTGSAVRGTVVDAEGAPGAHAKVQLSTQGGRGRVETVADDKGAFTLHGLQPGMQVFLQSSLGMMASEVVGPLEVPEQGSLTGVKIELQQGGAIGGQVVTERGAPAPGLYVLLSGDQLTMVGHRYEPVDDEGRFTMAALPPATYNLRVHSSGGEGGPKANATIELAAGQKVMDTKLVWDQPLPEAASGDLSISGQVVDDTGNPIPGVAVVAQVKGSRERPASAMSLSDGTFDIIGLAAGAYQIIVSSSEYVHENPKEIQAGTNGVRVELKRQALVKGTVIDGNTGQPITEFEMAWVAPGFTQNPSQQQVQWTRFQDPEGKFEFKMQQRQRGNMAVAARAEGYAPGEADAGDLSPGTVAGPVTIRLTSGAVIEGTVTSPDGAPVAAASVFMGTRTDYVPSVARTDAQGRFTLDGLAPVEITLSAKHDMYGPGSTTVTPQLGATKTVTIALSSGGVVEGHVRRGANPQSGIRMSMYINGGNYHGNSSTDSAGHYSFKNVPAGDGQVSVHLQTGGSWNSLSRPVVVAEDSVTTVDFDLPEQTGGVEGQITFSEDPAPDCYVTVSTSSETLSSSGFVQVGADGRYSVNNLPPGPATVSAYTRGGSDHRSERAEVEIVGGKVIKQDLHFSKPTVVAGVVHGLQPGEQGVVGILPGEVEIEVSEKKIQEYLGMLAGQTQVRSDGTFRVSSLEGGVYTVVAVAVNPNESSDIQALMNARMSIQVVEIEEGQEISLEMTLQ